MDATVDQDSDIEGVLCQAYRHYTLAEAATKHASGEPNKPCGCGSGKKTKKCCGNPATIGKVRNRYNSLSALLCSTH